MILSDEIRKIVQAQSAWLLATRPSARDAPRRGCPSARVRHQGQLLGAAHDRKAHPMIHPWTYGEALDWLRAHYPTLMPVGLISVKRIEWFDTHCDVFRIGDSLGLIIGEQSDWETYHIRLGAALPSVPRAYVRKVWRQFLQSVDKRRIVAETSPCNAPMVRLFGELGFVPTGQRIDERYGVLVEFTRHGSNAFEQVFAGTAPPRERG